MHIMMYQICLETFHHYIVIHGRKSRGEEWTIPQNFEWVTLMQIVPQILSDRVFDPPVWNSLSDYRRDLLYLWTF